MSIEISSYPPFHTQDTDHESWHFEHIDFLRDFNNQPRGEEFVKDLELLPVTNYFGLDRAIAVVHCDRPVSLLPEQIAKLCWPLVTALHTRNETLEVSARIWTSPEDREFYASVRIALPSVDEAEAIARNDLDLEDDHEFRTDPAFRNYIEDYTSTKWRAAHGMPDEEHERRVDETSRRVAEIRTTPQPTPVTAPTSQAQMLPRSQALIEYENTRKKGIAAWLLWLFLGGFGGHRFYFGHTGYAVGMLLLNWATFGLWGLIDALFINRNLRNINTNKWAEIAPRHGAPFQPLPDSAQ